MRLSDMVGESKFVRSRAFRSSKLTSLSSGGTYCETQKFTTFNIFNVLSFYSQIIGHLLLEENEIQQD